MAEDIYLTSRQVKERYGGLSRTSLWRLLKAPEKQFPEPIQISAYKRLWRLRDLEAWERANVRQRHAA